MAGSLVIWARRKTRFRLRHVPFYPLRVARRVARRGGKRLARARGRESREGDIACRVQARGTGRCNLEKDDVVSATWIRSPLQRSRQNPSTTASCCPRVVRRWLLPLAAAGWPPLGWAGRRGEARAWRPALSVEGWWDAASRIALLGSPERRESTVRAAQRQDDSGHGPLQSGKRRCRVRDVDTIPAPKEPTEPVHDRVLLPSSCSPLAAAGQWDRAGRCTWIMQQHLVRRRRAVSQTAGTESRGPRPPGAPSGAWSLLAVRRPTVKRNDPPGGKPGACQHVAEVPVSLSFSTGRADVLRMGWRRGQRAHLCPCMHRAATDAKLPSHCGHPISSGEVVGAEREAARRIVSGCRKSLPSRLPSRPSGSTSVQANVQGALPPSGQRTVRLRGNRMEKNFTLPRTKLGTGLAERQTA